MWFFSKGFLIAQHRRSDFVFHDDHISLFVEKAKLIVTEKAVPFLYHVLMK